ncbi:hypothetical protein [Mycolicibacterium hodleri]|uniref:hypothetical protein n=1 Tax=Mycolicibacterium hodleri TaxID=49897 RepID=UPI00163BAE31|nr:hypothetical protein [Mycolicibacterium hodleri]
MPVAPTPRLRTSAIVQLIKRFFGPSTAASRTSPAPGALVANIKQIVADAPGQTA